MSLTPATLVLFVSEEAAWNYTLKLGLILGTIVTILMGFEQRQVIINREDGESLLWHIPPWALASIMFALITYALFTGEQTAEVVIATATLYIPVSLSNFVALAFRKFF